MHNPDFPFAQNLLDWFDQSGRKDLPWQQNKTPYRVWVSEIMLQQTQVNSVILYYQRFMARFPTLESLANAHEDSVLELWAGLGYYARARNLHKTAQIIQQEHKGAFPDTPDSIIALPGIGRSTAGAILSIAYRQRAAILDGNVKRVLCRVQAISTWPGERKTETELWALAEQLTPNERVDDYTQAIMDLGATLCTRSRPDCKRCPMSTHCMAYQQGLQNTLPKSKPKKAIPLKHTRVMLVESSDETILMEKRPPNGIWGGLYSLPEHDPNTPIDRLVRDCAREFNCALNTPREAPAFLHTFSHYKLELQPILLNANKKLNSVKESDQYKWVTKSQLNKLGLPAPISKFLKRSGYLDVDLPITKPATD